ncbi:MAG: hypothetical protein V6Z82_06160 [Flavobacteriales bacterium]
MKAFGKIAWPIALVLGIFAYESCSDNSNGLQANRAAATPIALKKANDFKGLFQFPKGTVLTLADGRLHFTLPKGFRLIAKLKPAANRYEYEEPSAVSRVARFSDGSVNCKCEAGSGGCSPFVWGDKSGCSSDGRCTKCTLTISGDASRKDSEIHIEDAVVEDAAVVDLDAASDFVLNKDSLSLYRSPKGFIFADQAIRDTIQHIMADFNHPKDTEVLDKIPLGEKLPAGYFYIPVALFSKYLVLMPLNLEHPHYLDTHSDSDNHWFMFALAMNFMYSDLMGEDESDMVASFSTAKHFNCTCNSGGSGCKKGREYGVIFCEAQSCTDCTLNCPKCKVYPSL